MENFSDAIFKWSWYIMGYEIGFSIIIGFAVGYVARKLLKFSEKRYYSIDKSTIAFLINIHREWIDKESFLVYAIALAVSYTYKREIFYLPFKTK